MANNSPAHFAIVRASALYHPSTRKRWRSTDYARPFCLRVIFQGRRTGGCNLRVPIRLRRTHSNGANEFILSRERQPPPVISTKPAVTAPIRPL